MTIGQGNLSYKVFLASRNILGSFQSSGLGIPFTIPPHEMKHLQYILRKERGHCWGTFSHAQFYSKIYNGNIENL